MGRDICVYNWVTLLHSRNWHIVDLLCFNKTLKMERIKQLRSRDTRCPPFSAPPSAWRLIEGDPDGPRQSASSPTDSARLRRARRLSAPEPHLRTSGGWGPPPPRPGHGSSWRRGLLYGHWCSPEQQLSRGLFTNETDLNIFNWFFIFGWVFFWGSQTGLGFLCV